MGSVPWGWHTGTFSSTKEREAMRMKLLLQASIFVLLTIGFDLAVGSPRGYRSSSRSSSSRSGGYDSYPTYPPPPAPYPYYSTSPAYDPEESYYVTAEPDYRNGSSLSTTDDETSLIDIIPENVNKFVEDTAENGAKVASEVVDGVKNALFAFIDVGKKLERVGMDLFDDLTDRRRKDYGNDTSSLQDEDIDEKLSELAQGVKDEWQQKRNSARKYGIEEDAESLIIEAKEKLVDLGKDKQLVGEKVKRINEGVNEMLTILVDESEDLKTKAKPVVDAMVKVEELIKTPEVREVSEAIGNAWDSFLKVVNPPEPCHWSYSRERYVQMGYSSAKYWVDDEWIRCLSRRGKTVPEIWDEVRAMTGAPMGRVQEYLRNQFCCLQDNW